LAASCSTSGTWRPAQDSSEMNGVVFQISARQMTRIDVPQEPIGFFFVFFYVFVFIFRPGVVDLS
jgi:hypothetical protein